jgi:DNA end-binding protein Ku
VMPQGDALVLMLLRYPQELVAPDDYKLPAGNAGDYRVTAKEMDMARKLIQSMGGQWNPEEYHDEFRERLQGIIAERIKAKGATAQVDEPAHEREGDATNVVDFMALLQKSLGENKRTPAKKSVTDAVVKKAPAKKAVKKTPAKKAAKKAAGKKTATKKAAKKPALRKAG